MPTDNNTQPVSIEMYSGELVLALDISCETYVLNSRRCDKGPATMDTHSEKGLSSAVSVSRSLDDRLSSE